LLRISHVARDIQISSLQALWHYVASIVCSKLLLMLAAASVVNNIAKLCLQVMLLPEAHHLALLSAKHAL